MSHQAIYRRWRPTIFEDIVGQEHITRTLKNQILNNKIAHAYLFCGTRGTGKTTCAKVFSRAVNCLDPKDGSPCNKCEVCRGIIDGGIMDVKEIDAASNNGVDNIREIREDAQYVSAGAKYTVYIIDEVHMLSTGAFNALLKILEEPPENVIFILATTEAHKVPQTILSRCQRFDFKRIRPEDIILRMKEIALGDKLDISEDAYQLLAKLADGSMRDGLSILERVSSTSSEMITAAIITDILGISDNEQIFAITDAVINGDSDKILSIIDRIISDGKDIKVFADSAVAHFRDLLVVKVSENSRELLNYSAEAFVKVKAQCDKMTFESISNAVRVLCEAQTDAKWVKSPRVIFELAFIKMARPEIDSSPKAIEERLSAVENGATAQKAQIDPSLERRIDALEKKLERGLENNTALTAEQEKPVKKKQAPIRLYNPIPQSELNADNPVIRLARNWENTVSTMKNAHNEFSVIFKEYKITVDRDGIILLYSPQGKISHDFAVEKRGEIVSAFRKFTQSDYTIKIAFEEEFEGDIIDFWQVKDGNTEEAAVSDDPLDKLINLPITENVDDSEFTTISADDNNFEQSSIDDDESEEFLDSDELKM